MDVWMAAEAGHFITELCSEVCPGARRLLELGCGDGSLALGLLKVYPSASWKGYESDAALAEQAASRLELMGGGMSIVQEDLREARIEGEFDLALCAWGMIGFSQDDRERVLRRVHGALAQGGAFILADAVRPPESLWESYRKRQREDLASQGLSKEAIDARMVGQGAQEGLCTLEEELYRLRKAAFREVDVAWKAWDRAVFAALR